MCEYGPLVSKLTPTGFEATLDPSAAPPLNSPPSPRDTFMLAATLDQQTGQN